MNAAEVVRALMRHIQEGANDEGDAALELGKKFLQNYPRPDPAADRCDFLVTVTMEPQPDAPKVTPESMDEVVEALQDYMASSFFDSPLGRLPGTFGIVAGVMP